MISYHLNGGYRRSCVAYSTATCYQSVSQDLGCGWCYTGADCERRRGRYTWSFDVHSAGSCCRATFRLASYGVLPVISNYTDIRDLRRIIATAYDTSFRQDLGRGWCYAGADCERRRGGYTWCSDVHSASCFCRAAKCSCAGYGVLQ